MITKNTLEFGDYFCEIADAKTALTSKSAFLNETLLNISEYGKNRSKEVITEKIDDKKSIKIIMDFSALDDIINNDSTKLINNNNDGKKNIKIEDLHLLFYDPN